MRKIAAALGLAAVLGGCATSNYDMLPEGKFSGSVIVMWVGEGGPSGSGRFVYIPDPDDPLTFERGGGKVRGARIRPRMMYTDGGSIPPFAQAFNGFSPWGYAPAYMIHDWLFTARHCIVDGVRKPEYEPLRDVTFEDSAEILGEAIKTLVKANKVKNNDIAGSTITGAVASVIARELWDRKGACSNPLVDKEHAQAVNNLLRGSEQADALAPEFAGRSRVLSSPSGRRVATPVTSQKARIVSRVSF